jgi:hypothetical protein
LGGAALLFRLHQCSDREHRHEGGQSDYRNMASHGTDGSKSQGLISHCLLPIQNITEVPRESEKERKIKSVVGGTNQLFARSASMEAQ